jgi:4-aminobutyrate aminotransferase / (S)-3-amino-2-methylpropionate transaminase / 5-aminovalerate transaminase
MSELTSQELMDKKIKYVSRGISHGTPIFVKEAKGALITDVEGRNYIDFYGGIGVLNAGHCPPPVVEAIKNQAEKLIHTCFMVTMYDSYVDLAEKLTLITPGDYAKKALLVNSGAEAVENAIKVARSYTKRPGVISFELGFHGRTLLTMTLTSKVKPYKHGFGPFAPEVYKIPSAYCYRCYYKSTYPSCGMHCLEQFDRFFVAEVAPESIAAMIVEPVQGEGGFIVPPKEFLTGLQDICNKHGIVFVVDEVQTGFARTGKMFASEHFGLQPDVMTMAKSIASGMPLSAVVGKAEILDAPDPGNLGGTYAGNPLACAASLATIDFIEQENLSERAQKIGDIAMARLKDMQERYPIIGDVRGLGAMVAMELVKDKVTKEPAKQESSEIIKECLDQGLIIIGAGVFGNVIRMLMPLVITDDQLEHALNILDKAVAKVSKGV